MKSKFIQLVVAVFFLQNLYSQENVGINTSNPTAKLEVNGDVKLGINAQDSADLQILESDALISLGKGERGPHGFSFGSHVGKSLQMLYRTGPSRLVIEKGNTFKDSLDLFHLDYNTENSFFKGKMGIGTDNPLAKLDISGDLSFGIPTALAPDMRIEGTSALISLGKNSVGPHGFEFGDNGEEGLQFVYRSNFNRLSIEKSGGFADNTDLFAIDYDTEYGYFHGRVGLGTLAPVSKLEIQGVQPKQTLTSTKSLDQTAGNELISRFVFRGQKNNLYREGAYIEARQDGTWSASTANIAPSVLRFYTQSSESTDDLSAPRMSINESGNVGIGAISALSKLEIQGVQPKQTLTSTKSLDQTAGNELISRIVFRGQKNNLYREGAFIEARQDGTWSANDANFAPSALQFYTQSSGSSNDLNTPRMSINGSGLVTIGDISPAAGHILSIDGKVACEEVRVDLSQNWPDYVFLDNYPLAELHEVQAHIDQFGHLPGVPNAKSIEDNGLEVGEMQRILMEKIEELTLYILDQNERLKSLESELENLKSK